MRTALVLLAATIILTACVDVTVTQKLYRDNTVDMSLSFAGTDQVLSGFEGLKPNPAVADSFSTVREDGSLTYVFSHIPVGAHLFLLDPDQQGTFFGIEEYTLTKHSGFPFTTYSYALTPGNALPAEQNDQTKAILSAVKIAYRVETFGAVTKTNGQKLDSHTVEFSLDPTSTTPYTIEFREWFFSSWFG